MKIKKLPDFGLYFITDSRLTKKSVLEDVKAAIRAGVKIVQYREKEAPAGKMIKEAAEIRKLCKENNVLFLINDRIDIALAVGADGVHFGQDGIPYNYARNMLGENKIIGMSAHSAEDALNNEEMGADYTSIGPIFHTITKKDAKFPIGLEPVRQLKDKLKIPFVAIGGINEENIGEVLEAGARNIAIISAIVAKDNVEERARHFMEKINSLKHGNSNF
ncbi:thiamine phosphate synthase [Candidatus Woesearchaeota archaeon]|nr:thiamine phosphate synthase [Candidatus Woesearchaeota archaeon]